MPFHLIKKKSQTDKAKHVQLFQVGNVCVGNIKGQL